MRYVKSRYFAINILRAFTCFWAVLFCAAPLYAYQASNFSWIPPFQSQYEKPSITIIFDNSGSMNERAYSKMTFDSQVEYYGYFDPRKYYAYDTGKGYFYEVAPSDSPRRWNGNFLNWAAMLRLDAAKKVMTGGEYTNGITTFSQCRKGDDYNPDNPAVSINDSSKRTDLNGNSYYLTPVNKSTVSITRTRESRTLRVDGTSYNLKIKQDFKEGVIQKFADSARMSLFFYHSDQGALVQNYMGDEATHSNNIISTINNLQAPNNWTPLAESLYTVIGYISQTSTNSNTAPRYQGNSSYRVAPANDKTTDPYYFGKYKDEDTKGLVYCTKQNVILITDGEPTKDKDVPNNPVRDHFSTNIGSYPNRFTFPSDGSEYLIDVAYYGHTTDLRTGAAFPGDQNIDLFTVFASFGEGSSQFLKDATMFGSFKDEEQLQEYIRKKGKDIDVENYFEAQTGSELEDAVMAAFASATSATASGTAAAVAPQAQEEGEGAIYQAVFFPPTDAEQVTPPWAGHVHSLFIDQSGNLREDNNGNARLDLGDNIVKYQHGKIFRANPSTGVTIEEIDNILGIKSIWSSTNWLNHNSLNVLDQRNYKSTDRKRFIFTFVDKDQKMVPSTTAISAGGEVQPFVVDQGNFAFDLDNTAHFSNYLTLYDTKVGVVIDDAKIKAMQTDANNAKYKSFLSQRTKEQVKYIRGADLDDDESTFVISNKNEITEKIRSRKLDAASPVWRLGDIVYSSPTLVGSPQEGYDYIYNDWSYEDFYKKYLNRRQVVYVGANDGMLHAFNSGFYNKATKTFEKKLDSEIEYELGAELWAYVPYNLLPHLRWLMNQEYGTDLHVAYMDLEPRIFDVRIFFEADGITPIDEDHPNGWGTILVAGMRLGGADIKADLDKDGVADRTMSSAYVVMDITNPEEEPRLLAELSMPGQGFTTCHPAVMPMTKPDTNVAEENEWFLMFGSGPANGAGEAASTKMDPCTSDQAGKFFILDLKHLVTHKTIRTINDQGKFVDSATHFTTTEAGSFISDPLVLDLDIGQADEMKANVVYFGTVAGSQDNSTGQLYRLAIDSAMPTVSGVSWLKKPFINIQQPIVAQPNAAIDDNDRIWIYFGSGRYFSIGDADQKKKQSFYGIKEPIDVHKELTWGPVALNDLYDSSRVTISSESCGDKYTPTCVTVKEGATTITWAGLLSRVQAKDGWKRDFAPARERVLHQPAVYEGAVLFTSYIPSVELCDFGGTSNFWALYYLTGTPYFDPILPGHVEFIELGEGPPASRVQIKARVSGDSGSGAAAIIQTGSGEITVIKNIKSPVEHSSRELFWRHH